MSKQAFAFLIVFLLTKAVQCQFFKSVLPSPEFGESLEKIVLDFRLNFATIRGTNISRDVETEIYESTVKLPRATDCFIYEFHSKVDTSSSWQGIMYKGDSYKEAARVYENVFRMVRKSQVRWIDKTFVGFTGEMEKPTESLRFTVSTLRFQLEDKRYKNFLADVEIISKYDEWEVHLNLHTKKPDFL